MKETLEKIYEKLLDRYGYQGWWPILGKYHPRDYSYPKTKDEQFEIIIGAILTQNTNWKSVEKSLFNLRVIGALSPDGMVLINKEEIKKAIRPSGYFNQKAERLKLLAEWFIDNMGVPTREELLELKGVGPETADSILLYAYNIPSFVVDTYTRRILLKINIIKETTRYDEIKSLFENNLKLDYKIFQEFHALLVEHAKKLKAGENGFLDNL